jgi:hypothetical protein
MERAPGTPWIGGWVGPRTGLDDVERKKSCPYRDSNSDPSAAQPVASHRTDCAWIGLIHTIYFTRFNGEWVLRKPFGVEMCLIKLFPDYSLRALCPVKGASAFTRTIECIPSSQHLMCKAVGVRKSPALVALSDVPYIFQWRIKLQPGWRSIIASGSTNFMLKIWAHGLFTLGIKGMKI